MDALTELAELIYLTASNLGIDDMDSSDSYAIAGRILERYHVEVLDAHH